LGTPKLPVVLVMSFLPTRLVCPCCSSLYKDELNRYYWHTNDSYSSAYSTSVFNEAQFSDYLGSSWTCDYIKLLFVTVTVNSIS